MTEHKFKSVEDRLRYEVSDMRMLVFDLKEKLDFMHKRTGLVVKEEINIRLSEQGFKEYLFKTAGSFVKTHMKEIIIKVIKEVIKEQKRKIDAQNQYMNDLSLSIDNQVKHLIRKIDTSYSTDKLIKEHLNKIFESIEKDIVKIEVKEHNNFLEG